MSILSTVLAQKITIGGTAAGMDSISDLGFIISAVIGIVFILSGILVFAMLVWGGIQWITSGGDKDSTQKAKDRITNALVGIAIVASAWAITKLVEFFFGIKIIGSFDLPSATDAPRP